MSSSTNLNKNFGFSNTPLDRKKIGPKLYYQFSDLEQKGHVQLINRMMAMLAGQGITPHSITIQGDEIIAEINSVSKDSVERIANYILLNQ